MFDMVFFKLKLCKINLLTFILVLDMYFNDDDDTMTAPSEPEPKVSFALTQSPPCSSNGLYRPLV